MHEISELIKSMYENSLIKALKRSSEKEMEKLSGKTVFVPLGSTYNSPRSQTLYDFIGILVSNYFLDYVNSRGIILLAGEEGFKEKSRFSDNYELIYDSLKEEKKLKKLIRKILKNYLNKLEFIGLTDIDELKKPYVEQLESLKENIKEIFGKNYLDNLVKKSKRVGLYKVGNKNIEVLGNSLNRIYPNLVKTILPSNLEDRIPLIKNYLITNYLLMGREIGKDLNYLSTFAKKLENMESNDLEKLFQVYLNQNKQYSPIIPLGTLFYSIIFPYTKRNDLLLAVTNYTNPGDTKDFVEKTNSLVYPGLKIYIEKEENLYLVNNESAQKFLEKNKILSDKEKMDKLVNQIYEQISEQLNSRHFKDNYAFTIVLRDFIV